MCINEHMYNNMKSPASFTIRSYIFIKPRRLKRACKSSGYRSRRLMYPRVYYLTL